MKLTYFCDIRQMAPLHAAHIGLVCLLKL